MKRITFPERKNAIVFHLYVVVLILNTLYSVYAIYARILSENWIITATNKYLKEQHYMAIKCVIRV